MSKRGARNIFRRDGQLEAALELKEAIPRKNLAKCTKHFECRQAVAQTLLPIPRRYCDFTLHTEYRVLAKRQHAFQCDGEISDPADPVLIFTLRKVGGE